MIVAADQWLSTRVTPAPTMQQRINKLMRERAQYLASMERIFPKHRVGMTTEQYVKHYYYANHASARPFTPDDFTFTKEVQP